MEEVTIKNLYKIFGPHPKKAKELIEKGKSKEEILEKTKSTVAVNNVSFEVEKRETFVVMGLSGSGKSTLVRCLNRLIEPTSGQIFIGNEDVINISSEKLREIRRRKIGMVFQNFALFPNRSIIENVEYGLEIQGIDKEKRRKEAYKAIELVGLSGYENSMPDELSGGMQQRVGLARALANDPDILLMDEAFSALDPLIRREMQDQLIDLQHELHKTIIFITHDLDEALKLGNRIAIMKDGEIVQIGTAEEILYNPANEYVKDFVEGVDRSKVITAGTIMEKPIEVMFLNEPPKLAVRKMRKTGINSVLTVDKEKRIKGVLLIDKAVELVKENKKKVEEEDLENVVTVSAEDSIKEIMPMSIDSDHPLAVIDNNQKLLGVIVKSTLLSGIVGEVS